WTVAALIDFCLVRNRQVVATATEGPARLTHLPVRLTSRLAGGLVVGLLPLTPPSRLSFLQELLASRGLTLDLAIVGWLAQHLDGSGRQLDGAVTRLEGLTRLHGSRPTLEEVVAHFHD